MNALLRGKEARVKAYQDHGLSTCMAWIKKMHPMHPGSNKEVILFAGFHDLGDKLTGRLVAKVLPKGLHVDCTDAYPAYHFLSKFVPHWYLY